VQYVSTFFIGVLFLSQLLLARVTKNSAPQISSNLSPNVSGGEKRHEKLAKDEKFHENSTELNTLKSFGTKENSNSVSKTSGNDPELKTNSSGSPSIVWEPNAV
jgi:hypothetical protein